eukprot:EG_transcript_11939
MSSDAPDVSKLKVEELRKLLQARGEATSGTKAALIARLSGPAAATGEKRGPDSAATAEPKAKRAKAEPKPAAKAKAKASGAGEQEGGTEKAAEAKPKAAKPKADKPAAAAGEAEPGAKAGAKAGGGPSEADIFKDTVAFRRLTAAGDFDAAKHLKVISWNVNGLAALLKTKHLHDLVEKESPDLLCLQETKLQAGAADGVAPLKGYTMYSACSVTKLGYSGTRIYVKEGLSSTVQYGLEGKHLEEGRAITVELPGLYLVNTYVPNAGMELERLDYRVKTWDPAMQAHLQHLQCTKPVVWTGDLNVSERDYDRFFAGSYKAMSKAPGFTPEERASFRAMLQALGMTDSFRQLYPTAAHVYSFWSTRFNQRAKNNGWRLDYFVVSKALEDRVVDTFMLPDVQGSDHCPIVLWLKK